MGIHYSNVLFQPYHTHNILADRLANIVGHRKINISSY